MDDLIYEKQLKNFSLDNTDESNLWKDDSSLESKKSSEVQAYGFKFPQIFSFQVRMNTTTGERTVFATRIKSKSKVENKKFSEAKSIFLVKNIHSAVINILEINNENELKDELFKLDEIWGTE